LISDKLPQHEIILKMFSSPESKDLLGIEMELGNDPPIFSKNEK